MPIGEVSRFDWVRDSVIGEAGCITVVAADDLAGVARAFGGDMVRSSSAELAAARSDLDAPTALVRGVADWVVAVEDNGFEGSRPEVLRRLTGTTVSVFWNVNAVTRFSYAVDGTVLTAFEAMFPNDRGGAEPDAVQAQAQDLPWADESVDLVSVMLALAARVTGFVLQPDHLAGPMTLVPLLPWPEDLPDQVAPRYEPLTYTDPALSYALQHADDRQQWTAARAAVRNAAVAVGLGDDPALMGAAEGRAGAAQRTALDQMARDLRAARRWPEFRAVEAARASLGPDAMAAAFRAVSEAGYGVRAAGGDMAALRGVVLAALGDPPAPAGSEAVSATDGIEPWDRYRWIDQHWLGWAAELTFVRATGAAPSGAPQPRVLGAVRLERGSTWSLQVGEWTLLLEIGEMPRRLLDRLAALSADGEAVHVNWSARGQAHFWHVVDGELRSTFNAYQPDLVRGSEPSELDSLRAGLTFPLAGQDGGRQAPMLLALAERVTGVSLTPDLLDADWTEPVPVKPLEPKGPASHSAIVVDEFDSRLAALSDSWDPVRPDLAFYRDLAGTSPKLSIVDIGCGTGRLAVELARQGHHVTGIDPSPAMLAVARRREGAELVRWIGGDASALGSSEYDLALMTGNVVQAITDNRALMATLATIRRALRPTGRLAFDSRNPVARAWTRWTPSKSRRPLAEGIEAWYQNARPDGDLVTFQTHYEFAGGENLISHNQLRFRSYGWLRRALIDTGFHVEPMDHNAADLVFLASASTRQPVAFHITPDEHGEPVATIQYDSAETIAIPISGLDITVVLQRLRDLNVPAETVLRELERFDLGFDARADIRQRSEADMADWRQTEQQRREELKREFRQRREATRRGQSGSEP